MYSLRGGAWSSLLNGARAQLAVLLFYERKVSGYFGGKDETSPSSLHPQNRRRQETSGNDGIILLLLASSPLESFIKNNNNVLLSCLWYMVSASITSSLLICVIFDLC